MQTLDDLKRALTALDGKGYRAYRSVKGDWQGDGFVLTVDHVQGDPFAVPSRVRVRIPPKVAGVPWSCLEGRSRIIGTAAFLAREFADVARRRSKRLGTGRSGEIRVDAPGQEVIPQTAVQLAKDGAVEARFSVGLPARGRRIMGPAAADLLCRVVPACLDESLLHAAAGKNELIRHAKTNEDADLLRDSLAEFGLVAFVADGAHLARATGVSDLPLRGPESVPFESPPELRVLVELPHHGKLTGMGVPEGVTLIVGGGYHGKSTLLQALQWGVYNHRPGDGREFVVTDPTAVKIRAEDGRSVVGVDIHSFIATLPGGRDTSFFSSDNASGSTSQAAAISEAMEAGARLLLIDEDTAATNFMIRDRRMQALVPTEKEPITPLLDRVRQLYTDHDISTVLVIGGSGDYLDAADTVIAMESYAPRQATADARRIARTFPTGRGAERTGPLTGPTERIPLRESLVSADEGPAPRIKVPDSRTIYYGPETIDLTAVEQIVSGSQARAVAAGLQLAATRYVDGERTVEAILDLVEKRIAEEGLDVLDARGVGNLAAFRRFELAAALNRLRTLRVNPGRRGRRRR